MKTLKEQKYLIIGIIGLTLWLIETAYFGWNHKAQSVPEEMLNTISFILMFWGLIGDIFTNLVITKNYNIRNDKANIYYEPEYHDKK